MAPDDTREAEPAAGLRRAAGPAGGRSQARGARLRLLGSHRGLGAAPRTNGTPFPIPRHRVCRAAPRFRHKSVVLPLAAAVRTDCPCDTTEARRSPAARSQVRRRRRSDRSGPERAARLTDCATASDRHGGSHEERSDPAARPRRCDGMSCRARRRCRRCGANHSAMDRMARAPAPRCRAAGPRSPADLRAARATRRARGSYKPSTENGGTAQCPRLESAPRTAGRRSRTFPARGNAARTSATRARRSDRPRCSGRSRSRRRSDDEA